MNHQPVAAEMPYEFPDREAWPIITDDSSTREPFLCPPFADRRQAIERLDRGRDGRLHTIRLIPAHGNDWPLWDASAGYASEPAFYDLSSDLTCELRNWMDEWLARVHQIFDSGDLSTPLRMGTAWFSEGLLLTEKLAIEVWHLGDVIPEFLKFQQLHESES